MSDTMHAPSLKFALDAVHEASEPPEARGRARDEVRLLVSPGASDPVDTTFADIVDFLRPGDVVAVNTSATVPAAVDGLLPDGEPVVVHFSGALPGGLELVEIRTPVDGSTRPRALDAPVSVSLFPAGEVRLVAPFAASRRLWLATVELGQPTVDYLIRAGRPIRYRHVERDWPIEYYRTVFGRTAGSAEMPSASRPFTDRLVTRLVSRGVTFAPLLLHAGVSSLEGDEAPYPERYEVPATTADAINAAHRSGHVVVAVGTTVVRALATTTDDRGVVHPGQGWTEAFVDADHPVGSVDGLLTGWHEPESTHLLMLQAFAAPETLAAAYRGALNLGYLWHEFGDSHLILPALEPR
jgi:S-adenosylmethionine:tRNA ribosyltransferase-isomerase